MQIQVSTVKNGQMQNFLKVFKNEHFLKETTFVIQEMRRKMSDYTVEVNIKDLEDEIKKI